MTSTESLKANTKEGKARAQVGPGSQRQWRKLVTHLHLKDGTVGKTRRHMSLNKFMPKFALEEQVPRA
jgi:hypothetical protein